MRGHLRSFHLHTADRRNNAWHCTSSLIIRTTANICNNGLTIAALWQMFIFVFILSFFSQFARKILQLCLPVATFGVYQPATISFYSVCLCSVILFACVFCVCAVLACNGCDTSDYVNTRDHHLTISFLWPASHHVSVCPLPLLGWTHPLLSSRPSF